MAITKKLIVTLKDDVATPNEKVYIYRGDIGVDIIIELENFNYRIDSIDKKNMINKIEAYFKTPQGTVRKYNDVVDIISGDKIKFSFNKNVIDDMKIIGQYELQLHLFDKEDNRITIPSYFFYVKEPLHEDFSDEGAVVGYATVDYSKVQDDDVVLFAMDENGYIKTDWKTGDIITASKLNKIETQLVRVTKNTKELNDELNLKSDVEHAHSQYTTRMDLENYIEENKDLLKGDKGDQGLPGINGQDGEKGDKGDKGEDGLTTAILINGQTYTHNNGTITLPNYPTVPTKTSELINDSSFTTESYVENAINNAQLGGGEVDLSRYATKEELDVKVDKINGKGLSTNDLTNELKDNYDTAYTHSQTAHITTDNVNNAVANYVNEHKAELKGDKGENGENGRDGIDGLTTSISINGTTYTHTDGLITLPNYPTVPTKTSELTNDSSYATESYVATKIAEASLSGGEVDLSGYATKDDLATKVDKVAGKGLTTNDLTNELKDSYDTAYTHSQSVHAPSDAQKNSDITKGEIENKLVGNITTHTHNQYLIEHQDISNLATKTELNTKVDKVDGMRLSTNDYTTMEKNKLNGIEERANNYTHPAIHNATMITEDSTHRFVTDAEKLTWNNKSDFSGSYNDLTNKPIIPEQFVLPIANQTTLGGIKVGGGLSITTDGILSATGGGTADSVNWENVVGKPTKLSQFDNDSGFITSIPTEYVTETELEAKGYLTEHQDISGLATKTELNNKVDKVDGKGLSANDYTTNEKDKLNSIEEGANNYIHPNSHNATMITEDSAHRFVTDTEKSTWNNKSNFSGNYNDLTDKPSIPTVTNDLTNGLKANYDVAYTHSQSTHAPSDAQVNVQSDWNVSDTSSDAYIKNKPTIPTTTSQLTNNSGFLTSIPSEYVTETELNSKGYAKTTDIPTSLPANGGNADTIDNFHIWEGTQAQYNAISSKNSNTIYIIIG